MDNSPDYTDEQTDFFDDTETIAYRPEENRDDELDTSLSPIGMHKPDQQNLKSQIECVKLFVKELRTVADEFQVEFDQTYEPGSWQEKCAAKLKTARDILDVLVRFLETPAGKISTEQLVKLTPSIKRFAEFLGPVMTSFWISVYLCRADRLLHESAKKRFDVDIKHIDSHLERLTHIMPKLTNMIAEAGERLKDFIQNYKETGMQEEPNDLTTLFLRISAEMDIASNRLCAAEKCLLKVQRDIAVFKRTTLVAKCLLTFGVCTVSATLAHYTDVLTWRTAVIVSTASVLPLVHAHLSLTIDINDLLVKIRERAHAQSLIRCELEDLERRLRVLQKSRVQPRTGGTRARRVAGRCNSLPVGARSPVFPVSL